MLKRENKQEMEINWSEEMNIGLDFKKRIIGDLFIFFSRLSHKTNKVSP